MDETQTSEQTIDGELCHRCGNVGEDRRTVHMAGCYDLSELGLPFGEEVVFTAALADLDAAKPALSVTLSSGKKLVLGSGTVTCRGELTPHHQYTLRVCKACRADWMQAMVDWYRASRSVLAPDDEQCIPVMKHGVVTYITKAEWRASWSSQQRQGEGR